MPISYHLHYSVFSLQIRGCRELFEEHLLHLLPHATQAWLAPHFDRARALLGRLEAQGLGRWADRVRVVHRHLPLVPPTVDPEILERVQGAVLEGRRLDLRYRRRGEAAPRAYEVDPLALVFREGVAYLVGTLWRYDDVVQLALHRTLEAQVLPEARAAPSGFDLDAYIASGAFGFQVGEAPLPLDLRVDAHAGAMLLETPLAADQRVVTEPDGALRVTATVADTRQLRVWLRGFGPLAEVLGPAPLRAELAAEARATAALYLS